MSDFILFSDWDSACEDAGHGPEHKPGIIQPFHEMNTMEGSEFLDDALRMTEQPLVADGL
ncbi:hypothetical protein [Dyadobacter sp. NIV53]|uniref:hypothetical protein n=1 Tax=Dyadobacter sp. NIV53 TaxID=2861765 RepID=UPI001C88D810|nr:hypothetical protein [Dyadobacter sp. NIV53]